MPPATDRLVELDPEKLRFWRETKYTTQQKMANETLISRSYLAELESGKKRPSRLVFERILDCLELEGSALMPDD